MDGLNTLRAFGMYSGIQRNDLTLCVNASAYYKIFLTIRTAIFLLLF